jgi:hypothetical protein
MVRDLIGSKVKQTTNMLRTATRLARRPPLVSQSRPSSSAAAHDHHEHEQDDTVYPKEGGFLLTFSTILP